MSDTITPDAVTAADLEAVRDDFKREISTINFQPEVNADPLSKFRSGGELYHHMVRAGSDELETLNRALADNILANNVGVDQVNYVNQITNVVTFGRPTITAFGTVPVGIGQGTTIEWPISGADSGGELTGNQATEKTEVTSAVWTVTTGTAALKTYAGASDVAWQLIRHSQPSYLDALMAAFYRSYAVTSNSAAATELVAAATAGSTIWVPGTGTADELRAVLFEASIQVESATNMPATFVLAGSTAYQEIGSLAGLYPFPYGTQNVSGTADAGSLNVNVSGLPVIHDRNLAAGAIIVSNSTAAKWYEDGPFIATAENIALAGRDVGVFGMGVLAPYVPTGIISVPAA